MRKLKITIALVQVNVFLALWAINSWEQNVTVWKCHSPAKDNCSTERFNGDRISISDVL